MIKGTYEYVLRVEIEIGNMMREQSSAGNSVDELVEMAKQTKEVKQK